MMSLKMTTTSDLELGQYCSDSGSMSISSLYTVRRSIRQVENELAGIVNSGYRIGRQKEEDRLLQQGFDVGLSEGMAKGREMGRIYASCRLRLADADEPLKAKLTETMIQLENIIMKRIHRASTLDLPAVQQLALQFGIGADDIALAPDRDAAPS